MNALAAVALRDYTPSRDQFAADVHAGLARTPKRLPCKYFYDARGSALFERICEQPEYYLTRAELAILDAHGPDIAAALGPRVRLVEYGSGAGIKTHRLLDALDDPVAYVPVEISRKPLLASVAELAVAFPRIEMLPLCADFALPQRLPTPQRAPARTVVFFPGSTLGNFDQDGAVELLRRMRRSMGEGGAALVGIDLKKDRETLEAAYNDAAGVTAEFTLNLLARINRELDADFDLARFRHHAVYRPLAGRIETHILSREEQTVRVDGRRYRFGEGEAMLVEYSCKYALADIARLARRAGLQLTRYWRDEDARFAIVLLERAQSPAGSGSLGR